MTPNKRVAFGFNGEPISIKKFEKIKREVKVMRMGSVEEDGERMPWYIAYVEPKQNKLSMTPNKDSMKDIAWDIRYKNDQEEVRGYIKVCQISHHTQQVAYSTYHDSLTQVCFGCKLIRTNLKADK